MRHLRNVLAVLVLVAAVTACGDAPPEAGSEAAGETAVVPEWVTEVAVVANAIEARPGAADSILEAHAMTRSRLDSLLYEIAEDPVLTGAYREARGR